MTRGSAHYEIRVENPLGRCRGLVHAELDSVSIALVNGSLRVPLDEASHLLLLRLG